MHSYLRVVSQELAKPRRRFYQFCLYSFRCDAIFKGHKLLGLNGNGQITLFPLAASMTIVGAQLVVGYEKSIGCIWGRVSNHYSPAVFGVIAVNNHRMRSY